MKTSYLFDFDGTLVDSMPTFVSAMLRILDENGIIYDNSVIKTITPLGVAGTAEYYVNTLGVNKTKEEVMLLMKEYMKDAYFNTIPAKKNVISTLKTLKEKGISLNVLTASPHVTLDACLKRLDMWDLFDNVWSCDDFNTTKSNPEIYKKSAEKLGKSVEKIIFVDDNFNAVKTAKQAGMQAFGIYDDSSKDYIDEIKSVADRYLEKLSDLLE
jgi:HAD superfamily hydrolase (TIGR01509 family)